jgi:enoyl-CoA hydratase/carnithine racemase
MTAEEGLAWGFYSRLLEPGQLLAAAKSMAEQCARGPVFAHAMTKTMLNQEWSMSVDQALEAEAQAQAICMKTEDFKRAFDAFAARSTPEFVGR